jgi:BCD family chlorophyll transporter-like MFS transporter
MEAMTIAKSETSGLALGAWGAVQATCAGAGIAIGGLLRDLIAMLVERGDGAASMATRASGYATVYTLEIALLLAGLAALGPLVGPRRNRSPEDADLQGQPFGLREFPT